MPGRLRVLSGRDVPRILARFGFERISQKGSHVKVRWQSQERRVTISVPDHRTIKPGTLMSIYRDACRGAPESELQTYFFTD